MTAPTDKLPTLLDVAIRAAQLPSQLLLSSYRNPALQIETKPDSTFVTPADREAEQQIRSFLEQHPGNPWPVMGEEFGDASQGAEYRWVIDPIDGTSSFMRGNPLFGTLIAFEEVRTTQSLIGAIHLPPFGETYSARQGGGATCNGQPIRVSTRHRLAECAIAATPYQLQKAGLWDEYARLASTVFRFTTIADCWTHAMVARGIIDAAIEYDLSRWDIAATQILIPEAGGACLIRPSQLTPGKYDTIFGSPALVDQLAQLIRF
jgi:histidinol phosphatase-like enzyme (inositol monophosphatase family)